MPSSDHSSGDLSVSAIKLFSNRLFRSLEAWSFRRRSDGGYAEEMIAEARALVLIPDELKSEDAAPLVCAGITAFAKADLKEWMKPVDIVVPKALRRADILPGSIESRMASLW